MPQEPVANLLWWKIRPQRQQLERLEMTDADDTLLPLVLGADHEA
jgi:hypothetical protein